LLRFSDNPVLIRQHRFLRIQTRNHVKMKYSPVASNKAIIEPRIGAHQMKRCPECDSVFPQTDQFCEFDGTLLVVNDSEESTAFEDGTEEEVDSDQAESAPPPDAGWNKLAIVAIGGVAIGVVLFLIYFTMTRQPVTESANKSASTSSVIEPPPPLVPTHPSPTASASPSAEPSPTPSVAPSPPPKPAGRVELSSSPISTSGDTKAKSGPVRVKLTDGTTIEADEVWQTKEGIWYRRRGLVTLLNPQQVTSIEKVPTPTPQPSPAQSPHE
jgi:hypothetical protein